MSIQNLEGKRFTRLTVIEKTSQRLKNGSVLWKCRCECGNEILVSTSHLNGGWVKSCGCLKREVSRATCLRRTVHGDTSRVHPEYGRLHSVWSDMIGRCENQNALPYPNYGGRGIKVCDDWHDYKKFKAWALESGYDKDAPYGQCTLDRKDNNGDYEPSNCRWVDMKTQANNRRVARDAHGRYMKVRQ
jgi:hypothetical protein